jgi:hypothetical protein
VLKLAFLPNPSSGIFQLNFDTSLDNGATYQVYDLNGKMILSNKINNVKETIDLSNFNKGIYQLKVSASNQTGVIKLIKN